MQIIPSGNIYHITSLEQLELERTTTLQGMQYSRSYNKYAYIAGTTIMKLLITIQLILKLSARGCLNNGYIISSIYLSISSDRIHT